MPVLLTLLTLQGMLLNALSRLVSDNPISSRALNLLFLGLLESTMSAETATQIINSRSAVGF